MILQLVTISVIIPIYNDELYLSDALLAIQQQTFADFECICVNDGSIDKSEEIINKFVQSDSRFVKINRINGGVSAARNTGLEAARGEYVYDDLTPNYTLKKLYEAAKKYNADMARGRMKMIAEDYKLEKLPKDEDNSKEYFYTNPLTDYYRHIRRKNKKWYYIWMCLFKRSVLKDIRFHEELHSGGEDNLFTFDVVANIKNFVQISDVVACHRYSKISVTLNSYNPMLFINISKIIIPHIYQKYALNPNVDKRLIWWVYRKQSYAVYRFLIRINDKNAQNLSNKLIRELENSPEFKEIVKRWKFRQKIFYHLFKNEKYDIARKFKSFM